MKLSSTLIFLLTMVLIAGCISSLENSGQNQNQTTEELTSLNYKTTLIEIIASANKTIINAEIADTREKRQQGLMFRASLGQDDGMLFIFEDELPRPFWMKNTLISLDIIFISANLTITDIKKSFEPCQADPCPTYTSKLPSKYVLEVNGGFAGRNGIKIGDTLIIPEAG